MRDYDPTTGRYMQPDPLGLVDGASVYGYARQNPGRYVDPRGECIGPLALVCVGAGAIVGEGFWGAGVLVFGGGLLFTLPGDTPTTGEDAQSEANSETGCPDPCKDALNRLRQAKADTNSMVERGFSAGQKCVTRGGQSLDLPPRDIAERIRVLNNMIRARQDALEFCVDSTRKDHPGELARNQRTLAGCMSQL